MYRRNYYPAMQEVSGVIEEVTTISIEEMDKGLAFIPQNPKVGLIFYPGAMVEYTAYAPLMMEYAKEGVLCVLLEMPLSLAVLDMEAAEGVSNSYPQVTSWYVGGHSLGGAAASNFLVETSEHFDGLLLLAAYSNVDLSDSDWKVISIYGEFDEVLNHDAFNEYDVNLPDSTYTFEISGGNHSNFAYYGNQAGDGVASISREEQIASTVQFSLNYMFE